MDPNMILIGRCEFIHLLRSIPINLVSTAAIQSQSVSEYVQDSEHHH